MNLSAMNPGLTEALSTPLSEAKAPGQATARPPNGVLSGQDFAAFLRNQVNALKSTQRQEVAAAKAANLPTSKPEAPSSRLQRPASEPARPEPNSTRRLDQANSQKADVDNTGMDNAGMDNAGMDNAGAAEPTHALPAEPADTSGSSNLAHDQASAGNQQTQQSETPRLPADSSAAQASPESAELTTIPLSPNINIITATQALPSDKSVADFALAMGLAPDQVQALFGNHAVTTNIGSAAMSTQQMLGTHALASVSAPGLLPEQAAPMTANAIETLASDLAVSSADFQALRVQSPVQGGSIGNPPQTLEILNFQAATGQVITNVMPVSSLAVLSMMDAELRLEDIEALQKEFDSLSSFGSDSTSEHGLGLRTTESGHAAQAASKAAAAFAAQTNMAETYDKLSQKLATELAGRMHDQLNAGEWKMKFALKPASLGLVDVQLEMRDGQLTAQFNADTKLTQDLIQSGSQRLREALGQLGMNNASVLVGQGQNQHQGSSSGSDPSTRRADNHVTLSDGETDEKAVQLRPRHSNSLQFDSYA